jgi:hypothetical protein
MTKALEALGNFVGTLGAIYVVVGILALRWLDPGAHLQINGMVLEISRQSRPAGDHLVVWPLSFQVKLADRSQEIEAQRQLKEYQERMEVLEALQQRDRRPGPARNNQ